jgi:hypothetical protein
MQKKLAKGVVIAAVLSCTLATGVQASCFLRQWLLSNS